VLPASISGVRPFDVGHHDPLASSRRAAVRSAREQDPATREHARGLTPSERLETGFELSRFARRLLDARNR